MMVGKKRFALGAVAGVLLAPSLASAAQGPHKHDPGRHPNVDLDEKIPIEGGKTATRREILSHIDPKMTVEVHNGQRITVAELFGHLRDIENRHGQPLHTIPAQQHVHPASEKALQSQSRVHAEHVAQLRRSEQTQWRETIQRRATRRHSGAVGAGVPSASGSPALQPLHAGWQKEFGHEDTLAAYGSFSTAVEAPNDHSAVCLASLDFGGYLLKHHQSLARVAFHEEAITGSSTGNLGVYVLGNATAVYKRDFKVGAEQGPRWSHTWTTPEFHHEIGPFWGIITFTVKAKGSASFDLTASNGLDATPSITGCTADVQPTGSAKAIVDVGAKIGIPKLSHLLKVGVKGDVRIAKVTTPASAGMRLEQKRPVSMNETLKAKVDASFLNGELTFEVDLANPCIHIPLLGKHCLLGLFHVKSHYEMTFHKWNGFTYDNVLLDVTRTQPLGGGASPSPSASSSAAAPPPSSPPACVHDPSKPFNVKACDDYVAAANRCAARPGPVGAQSRAETNAQRVRFEAMMCQDGGPAKLPDMCDEALRFLKRSCP